MLRLLVGPAGSGKSDTMIREIICGGAARPVRRMLIVPEQYSHRTERALCAAGGAELSRYAEVFSFTGLARRVFAEAGGVASEYLDDGGRLLVMYRALQQVRSGLTVYGRAAGNPEFIRALVDSVDELKTCGVTAGELSRLAEQVDFSQKLSELASVLEAYESLTAQAALDPRDRLVLAAERMRGCSFGAGDEVYLDSFTDFTVPEMELVRLLLERAASVTVALTCDTLQPDGAPAFDVVRRTASRLLELAGRCGVSAEIIHRDHSTARDPAVAHLAKGLYDPSVPPFEGANSGVALFEAEDFVQECRMAASEILRLVRDEGCRFRDIGVAVRGLEESRGVIEGVFASFGIPVFVGGRSDILARPVAACVLSALETVVHGFEYEDLFRGLKTGLAPVTPEECDLLENYVLQWNIRGSLWFRDEPWTFNPMGFDAPESEESAARLARLNELRERVRIPLVRLRQRMADSRAAGDYARALYEYLLESELPEQIDSAARRLRAAGQLKTAEEYEQLWEIVIGALDQFHDTLNGVEMDRETFARLFSMTLSCYDVGSIPVSLDRVTVGELVEMGHGGSRYLFVLRCNDTVLPRLGEQTGVISEPEREQLRELGLELKEGSAQRLSRELYGIYAALTEPSCRVYLSMARSDSAGESLRPAFFVPRVRELFPETPVHTAGDGIFADSRDTCFEAAASAVGGEETPLGRAALVWLSGEEHSAHRLEALRRAAAGERPHLGADAVRQLYGDSVRLSASRIDKFYSCKFAYYLQYGLKLRPFRRAEFEAPELGTFIHFVLENLVREVESLGGFAAVEDDVLHRLVDRYVELYAQQTLGGFRDRSPRFRYLFRRLTRDVDAIVMDMAGELRTSEFRPVDFELKFGGDGRLPPVSLINEDGQIFVSGLVDRVDGWEHNGRLYLRVVDYKTGRKSFDLTDVANGLGMQMLIYLFALGRYGRRYYGRDVEPAGVLYVPARDVIVSGERGISEEQRRKKVASELRRSGVILDDVQVIRAMERGQDDNWQYLPVKLDKDGNITGASLLSAERLGRLSRHVDKLLLDIASELHRGSIAPDPYQRGNRSSCQYCDYARICHFGDHPDEEFRLLHTVSDQAFWDQLEGEEALQNG